MLWDIYVDKENSSDVDILVPLLKRDILSAKKLSSFQEDARALKRAKLDKLGNLMKNITPKESWSMKLEKRLDVFKQSLNVWTPGEKLKPEIDTR